MGFEATFAFTSTRRLPCFDFGFALFRLGFRTAFSVDRSTRRLRPFITPFACACLVRPRCIEFSDNSPGVPLRLVELRECWGQSKSDSVEEQ